MELSEAFVAPAAARAAATHHATHHAPRVATGTAVPRHGATLSAAAAVAAVGVLSNQMRRHRPKLLKRRLAKVTKAAVPPESIDLLHPHVWSGLEEQSTQLLQHFAHLTEGFQQAGDHAGTPKEEALSTAVQQLTEIFSEAAGRLAHEIVPPAYAADAKPIELDPNVTYLYGADGNVLVDPMNNKPLPDDWWNGFIGFQSDIIKQVDQTLRDNGRTLRTFFKLRILLRHKLRRGASLRVDHRGVHRLHQARLLPPAAGSCSGMASRGSFLLCSRDCVFYCQGQLKSTSMMQLLSPKVKEIQEKYKAWFVCLDFWLS